MSCSLDVLVEFMACLCPWKIDKTRDSRYYAKCYIYRYANVCKIEWIMQKKAGYAKLENEPGKRTRKNSKIKSGKNPGEKIWYWHTVLENEPGEFCKNF